jgi:hypothetical protein
MDAALEQLCAEFARRTEGERLLALSEGLIKVRVMEVALSLGWVLQEGAGGPANAPVADYLWMEGGELRRKRILRLLRLIGGSCDFTVVAPHGFMLEIKARSDVGTKSQAQFEEMGCDVRRVASEQGVGFLFVIDEKVYLSFSGDKNETRGRPAKFGAWFNEHFPRVADLVSGEITSVSAIYEGVPLELRLWVQQPSPQCKRFIVAGCRKDVPFRAVLAPNWRVPVQKGVSA